MVYTTTSHLPLALGRHETKLKHPFISDINFYWFIKLNIMIIQIGSDMSDIVYSWVFGLISQTLFSPVILIRNCGSEAGGGEAGFWKAVINC